jgi:hypothetical protein
MTVSLDLGAVSDLDVLLVYLAEATNLSIRAAVSPAEARRA